LKEQDFCCLLLVELDLDLQQGRINALNISLFAIKHADELGTPGFLKYLLSVCGNFIAANMTLCLQSIPLATDICLLIHYSKSIRSLNKEFKNLKNTHHKFKVRAEKNINSIQTSYKIIKDAMKDISPQSSMASIDSKTLETVASKLQEIKKSMNSISADITDIQSVLKKLGLSLSSQTSNNIFIALGIVALIGVAVLAVVFPPVGIPSCVVVGASLLGRASVVCAQMGKSSIETKIREEIESLQPSMSKAEIFSGRATGKVDSAIDALKNGIKVSIFNDYIKGFSKPLYSLSSCLVPSLVSVRDFLEHVIGMDDEKALEFEEVFTKNFCSNVQSLSKLKKNDFGKFQHNGVPIPEHVVDQILDFFTTDV